MARVMDGRMITLMEALVAAPDGLDIYEIGDLFGWDVTDYNGHGRQRAFAVIRALRLTMANSDDDRLGGFTVPIRHVGTRQLYFLAANVEDGVPWQSIRASTVLSRLEVDQAHWQALARSTDGRSHDGRIARACVRHFSRLIEDLQDINLDGTS